MKPTPSRDQTDRADEILLLTVDQVSAALQCGVKRVYNLISERRIPSVRLGRRVYVPRHLLRSWLDAEAVLPPGMERSGFSPAYEEPLQTSPQD